MDEVAKEAAVSKPTVYNHFADKPQLFAAVVSETVSEVDKVVATVVRSFENVDDVRLALRRLGSSFLTALLKPGLIRLRRLVIATADRFPEVSRSWYEAGFGRVLSSLAAGFAGLQERQLLAIDDPLMAANHFVGLLLWIPLNQAMFVTKAGALPKDEIERQAEGAVRAFLNGYQMPRRAPRGAG